MPADAVFGDILDGVDYEERPSVYGITFHHGKIAVIRVDGKEKEGYFLPGGGKHPGETDIECLRRETLEELGYAARPGGYIGTALHYSYCPPLACYLKLVAIYYGMDFEGEAEGKIEADHHLLWVNAETAIHRMALEHHAWAINRALGKHT